MIPDNSITEWSTYAPWATRTQIEQDLLLSRLMIEISNNDYLGTDLIFRGGTCLHKLHLPTPYRYSEDLDYVRENTHGIKDTFTELGRIASNIGFSTSTELNKIPKFFMRTTTSDGSNIKIKIEINAHERTFAHPRIRIKHTVTSNWFSGSADILTFQVEEMVATKIRALYQRRKGRDLFDLWLALNVLNLDPTAIVSSFACYNPGFTARQSIANLREKLQKEDFRQDLSLMLIDWPVGYEIDQAAEELIEKILLRI
jgi:predicted nucleotidyltransferase component of viral defense system